MTNDSSMTSKSPEYSLIVIGAGAAGLFCAINAARLNPRLKILVVEKSGKILSKVKISGGGRCNVTHACFDIAELIKNYPRGGNFLKKTFHQFGPRGTIEWFEKRGVALKTEADGRMFPVTDHSQTIIDCLVREMNQYNIELRLNFDVEELLKKNESFAISNKKGHKLIAENICICSGGFPKSAQYEWIRHLGHSIEEPVPSLFTFNVPNNPVTQLMGISVENTTVKIVGSKLTGTGPLLITHWGFSGPAVLRLSAWGAREFAEKQYNFTALINWLPDFNEQSLQLEWPQIRNRHSTQLIKSKNPFGLPQRLWIYLLKDSGINEELYWSQLPAKQQNKLIQNLTAQLFEVKGKTTFKEEFVTCGGIKLTEIDPHTMQSRLIPGLYFAGEILNVDGITGGFNFQHAWTSGWIAANAIGKVISEK